MQEIKIRKKLIPNMYQYMILTPIVFLSLNALFKNAHIIVVILPLILALLLAIVMNLVFRKIVIVEREGIRKGREHYEWERILHIDYEERLVVVNRRRGVPVTKTFRFLHMKGIDFTLTFDVSEIKKHMPAIMDYIHLHRHITVNELVENIVYSEKKKQSTEPASEKFFVIMFAVCIVTAIAMFLYSLFI